MKENQAQQSKSDDSEGGDAKNVPKSDDVENQATGDSDTNSKDHQSKSRLNDEESKENRTHTTIVDSWCTDMHGHNYYCHSSIIFSTKSTVYTNKHRCTFCIILV